MNCERYRLILYHDMIIDGDVFPLDNPIATQYVVAMPQEFPVSVPVVVNEMIERLKGYMLNLLEQDAEQTNKVVMPSEQFESRTRPDSAENDTPPR